MNDVHRVDDVDGVGGDRRFEIVLGRLLRIGVAASSLCLAVGLAMTLVNAGSGTTHVLLSTGLLLLMATPAVRVVVSAVSYASRHDWVFAALTLVVLLELVASVAVAFRR